jgi:hypothetical protein
MTGATHMLAAATIYKIVPSKPIALALALGSHFLLDAIPHYEIGATSNYILGTITITFLFILAFITKDYIILVAAFLGALPDLNWMLGFSQTLDKFHSFTHVNESLQQLNILFIAETVIDLVLAILILSLTSKSSF